jgi:tetratricopeptide (TPR) repeat protein
MPKGAFISYRRDDAAGDAGRLADHLRRRFGQAHVFLDVDTIAPGADFAQVLKTYLQRTAAVLVVIGPRWTSLRQDDGTRRLDSPVDFVRFEVETALAGDLLVVPVLVQGATMPRPEDLPPSLASLVRRQAASLDHAEFHADAERLCDSLAAAMGATGTTPWSRVRRWWPAALVVVGTVAALGLVRIFLPPQRDGKPVPPATSVGGGIERAPAPGVATLLAEAAAQRRRNQFVEALATLARARELAPVAAEVRRAQEDVAMDWIREVRVEGGKSSFGEAIKPALKVVDASLPSATAVRRADLLSHTGWAKYLLWRDGDRRLDPTKDYREALSLDPGNPYANAMLAHWMLGQDGDLPGAEKLFGTAARSGRAIDAVRTLQWAAYRNTSSAQTNVERVRLADAMRRGGEKLTLARAQDLWAPYYFATLSARDKERQLLLDAVSPDDHISTLGWAFEEYAANDEHRRRTIRYYVALLHASAGRADRAADDLQKLDRELAGSSGSLADAVRAALGRVRRDEKTKN